MTRGLRDRRLLSSIGRRRLQELDHSRVESIRLFERYVVRRSLGPDEALARRYQLGQIGARQRRIRDPIVPPENKQDGNGHTGYGAAQIQRTDLIVHGLERQLVGSNHPVDLPWLHVSEHDRLENGSPTTGRPMEHAAIPVYPSLQCQVLSPSEWRWAELFAQRAEIARFVPFERLALYELELRARVSGRRHNGCDTHECSDLLGMIADVQQAQRGSP